MLTGVARYTDPPVDPIQVAVSVRDLGVESSQPEVARARRVRQPEVGLAVLTLSVMPLAERLAGRVWSLA